METAPVQYAIVDGAVEEGLLDFLNEEEIISLLWQLISWYGLLIYEIA